MIQFVKLCLNELDVKTKHKRYRVAVASCICLFIKCAVINTAIAI